MLFKQKDILSIAQFDCENIQYLFHIVKKMQYYIQNNMGFKVLDGAILNNLFFESSTRTRLSFASAFYRLGGKVMETTDQKISALNKGETIADTAKITGFYSDIIVMRHPQAFSVNTFAEHTNIPVINAGDGDNEHPTQALLDLYSIYSLLPEQKIEHFKIAFIGDLKYSRTVHSLLQLLNLFNHIEIILISPNALSLPEFYTKKLTNLTHKITIDTNMYPHLNDVDFIYMTRIQEERFASKEEAKKYQGQYVLNQRTIKQYCKKHSYILHPLPRNGHLTECEISTDLNQSSHLYIFQQAYNGLLVRMALFCCLFNVENLLEQYTYHLSWKK